MKYLIPILLFLATLAEAEPRPPGLRYDGGYVSQDRCTACHTREAAAWATSHHSWSLREAREGNVLGNFDNVEFADPSGVRMRFLRQGEHYVVNTEGEDGQRADFPIAYTFGFDPLQQYLIERPGGRLQSLTVAWDSRPREAGGQRWFSLYPGQRFSPDDALHWTGRYQNWNAMCADCHSGNLRKGYDAASDTFQTTWSEMAVGCQSCHGPGQRHLDWAAGTANDAANKGLAVDFHDPAKGYQVEQCARCHSRRETLGAGSQPGKPLLDAVRPVVLSPGLYHADGQMLDEVFEYGSFTQSRMFEKGVTCSNCHEPHSTQLRAEGNDLCKACHNPAGNPQFPSLRKNDYGSPRHHFHQAGAPGSQCVDCHMPPRTYMGVDARRDHALRIPRPDLDGRTAAPDACTTCHQDRRADWAAQAIEGWYGSPARDAHYGETFARARRHDPAVIRDLAQLIEDTTRPDIVRATAVELGGGQGNLPGALQDGSALVRLQAARAVEGEAPARRAQWLLPLLRDPSLAVRDQAARGLADLRDGGLAAADNQRLGAQLADHEQRLLANADLPATRLNLALLQERQGRAAAAIDNYRQALRQDARYVPARSALARLLMAQGQVGEAEQWLRAGLDLQKGEPELAMALGLVLAQQGRNDEAIAWLRQARGGRAAYNLGLLLVRQGQLDDASSVLLKGLEEEPGNADLRYTLAWLSAKAGRPGEALGYCAGSADPRCVRLGQALGAGSR
ncbi:tetratricopeptide repeat protein [Pseudomonas sp. zfem002]|uniref:tetratricopeptide repeat protein n=1 Tax=Pseudomonas sp. zfem002 TaxID=3078197 RepID=UPI002928788D|nr:tetratricopeptide repeat protein [Pseudomonas sp. zfem002]MDU9392024.1 tetratricopeptide repeat protein [Pseudomonas sp. zfem002]